jgi:hypothetical protein
VIGRAGRSTRPSSTSYRVPLKTATAT